MKFRSKNIQQQVVYLRVGQYDFGIATKGGQRFAELTSGAEVGIERAQTEIRRRRLPLANARSDAVCSFRW